MKKIILLLLLLLPVTLNAYYYQWSDDIMAVYEMENANDTSGNNYHGNLIGSDSVFTTSKSIYDKSMWVSIWNVTSYMTLPNELLYALGQERKITLMFWLYNDTDVNFQSGIMGGGTGSVGTNTSFNIGCYNIDGWYPNNKGLFFNWDSLGANRTFKGGETERNLWRTWARYQFEFDGTQTTNYLKTYLNGELCETISIGTDGNVFKYMEQAGMPLHIGVFVLPSDTRVRSMAIDNVIFSNKLYNGAEILPIGIMETKYFTSEEIIYFDKTKIIYQ
jgi:hypothetical protein